MEKFKFSCLEVFQRNSITQNFCKAHGHGGKIVFNIGSSINGDRGICFRKFKFNYCSVLFLKIMDTVYNYRLLILYVDWKLDLMRNTGVEV